jgi:hypothetical protein
LNLLKLKECTPGHQLASLVTSKRFKNENEKEKKEKKKKEKEKRYLLF